MIKNICKRCAQYYDYVFAAEQREGKTYFIDPQTGDTDCERYFEMAMHGQTKLLRIDNNTPSDDIKDCCENRR